jgi:hypothetical protein
MDVFWCLRHVRKTISFVSGDDASTDQSPSGASHERNTAVGVDKGSKGIGGHINERRLIVPITHH